MQINIFSSLTMFIFQLTWKPLAGLAMLSVAWLIVSVPLAFSAHFVTKTAGFTQTGTAAVMMDRIDAALVSGSNKRVVDDLIWQSMRYNGWACASLADKTICDDLVNTLDLYDEAGRTRTAESLENARLQLSSVRAKIAR
jgi:hypothetical protein